MPNIDSRSSRKHVFFLEFNELSPHLIERFIGLGELPNFKKFRDDSRVYRTVSEESGYDLEPWIQWVSVHTGCSLSTHGLNNLGDNQNLAVKTIGQCLSEAGLPVGIFGSMNLRQETVAGYYIPDPWDLNGRATPQSLQTFYNTIASQVQGSSENKSPSFGELASLTRFLLMNGISWKTIQYGISQILNEVRNSKLNWRRATVLDRINYDVALQLNRKFNPVFSTYFSNSTAHYQHYYWQNLEPDLFGGRDDIDTADDANAVLYGYRNVDYLLGRFMRDYPDSILILVTALSQEPWTDTTKRTYRPINFEEFLKFCGIEGSKSSVHPIMAEEFRVDLCGGQTMDDLQRVLAETTFQGEALMKAQFNVDNAILGCRITSTVDESAVCTNSRGESKPFAELFSPVGGVRSGKHNSEGVFWVRDHRASTRPNEISLYDIAPATLSYFDVAVPPTMPSTSFSLM